MSASNGNGELEDIGPSNLAEDAPRSAPRSVGRKVLLPFILVALVIAWGVQHVLQTALEAKAAPLASKAVQENSGQDVDVVSKVTVSREAILFGTPHAKVEVFVRPTGDVTNAGIQGIEYDYALENGEWVLRDSGGCTSEECAIRGREAFGKR